MRSVEVGTGAHLRRLAFLVALAGCAEPPIAEAPVVGARVPGDPAPLHLVLLMDITNSWTQANFANTREAALALLDDLAPTAEPDDLVGMVVFTGRYGVEFTPMTPLVDAAAIRPDWEGLRTASKAGHQLANGNCMVFPYTNSRYPGPGPYPRNEFGLVSNTTNDSSWPQNTFDGSPFPPQLPRTTQTEVAFGGCYPNMWREYIDESGTDHANAFAMARTMFAEHPDRDAYRAMVILTDGQPNGTGAHATRDAVGFVESRWRWVEGPLRTTNEVQADTVRFATRAWDRFGISTWALSFVDHPPYFADVAHGDGVHVEIDSSPDFVPALEEIAAALAR